MSIHAFWDDENQSVIRFLYRRGSWEWHDFYAALEEARILVESVEKQVGFVIDISYAALTPGIFMAQSKVLHEFRRHPGVNLVIVVGADRFIEALYQISSTNVPMRDQYYFAPTLDDAYEIFEEISRLPRAVGAG